ncbi:MAG: amidohydrolase family protein [Gammaproteobacteria bacterium]
MKRGLKICDSDGHLIESHDIYERYMDPRFSGRVTTVAVPHSPMPIRAVDGVQVLAMASATDIEHARGYESWLPENMVKRFGEVAASGWKARPTAACLEGVGVDLSVTYGPGFDCWVGGMDPQLAAEMAKAYCRWLVDYSGESGGRITGAAPVPLQEISLAMDVVRFAYDLGLRAFWTRPNPVNGRTLGDRCYDPLYALLQDLDVPFATHCFQGGVNLVAAGRDHGFSRQIDQHVCEHPMEAQMAMLSMVVNGVFDRFPRLRMGYFEAGAAWAPYWLSRMTHHLHTSNWKKYSGLKLEPVEYFQRNIWLTTECDEDFLYQAIEALGDDKFLFPTDFPHPDATWPGVVDEFLDMPRVSTQSKQKILWDNAMAFYGFDESRLPDPVPESTA